MKIDPTELIRLISDHPWPGCQVRLGGIEITCMSDGIASMILVAACLMAVIIPLARRWRPRPTGGANLLEVVVIFVRDMIARPALGARAYDFLPFLLTMFLFIGGLNLMGLVPLEGITTLTGYPVGGVPTSIPVVCASLAGISLFSIVFLGLRRQALLYHQSRSLPMWACGLASPVLWLKSLCPDLPGAVGVLLLPVLVVLELIGAVAKCFALVVRLFANMLSGHTLLALFLMFFLRALAVAVRGGGYQVTYIGPFVIMVSVVFNILEILVAALQAYIFTFLTAMFIGMYVESVH